MSFIRSPGFPFWTGCLFALSGALVWSATTQEMLGWVLVILGLPLLFEGEAWRRAASLSSSFHDLDSDTVFREAYNPRAALPRCLFLYAWLFAILYLRETGRTPEALWTLLLLSVGPIIIYAAWAIAQYRRDIRRLIKAKRQAGISF